MPKELEQTLDEFKLAVGDPPNRKDLLMVVNHEEDPTDMLYVFFPDEEKVNTKTIRAYLNQMQQDSTYRAILVLKEKGLTPFAKTVRNLYTTFDGLILGTCRTVLQIYVRVLFRERTHGEHN